MTSIARVGEITNSVGQTFLKDSTLKDVLSWLEEEQCSRVIVVQDGCPTMMLLTYTNTVGIDALIMDGNIDFRIGIEVPLPVHLI